MHAVGLHMTQLVCPAQSLPAADTFIFALQLEYLEADFYWWAVKVSFHSARTMFSHRSCRMKQHDEASASHQAPSKSSIISTSGTDAFISRAFLLQHDDE